MVKHTSNKPVIGIVGGIGSGKSTVAAEFAALGCRLIDADRIGHDLLARSAVKAAIRAAFGDGVFTTTGDVDRRALGHLVFADPAALGRLNAILHPLIRAEMVRIIADAQADPAASAVVMDAAVMFEAGWDGLCTCCVFVDAPAAERWARVKASRPWTEEQWRQREKSQISLDAKKSKCYYLLDNSSSASCLSEQVRQVFLQILSSEK